MPGAGHARGPFLAAVDMGYGHLRAAHALASAFGVPLHTVDRPPFASRGETRLWNLVRAAYTGLSRLSQPRGPGKLMRGVLETITEIPRLYPYRDLSEATLSVRLLRTLIRLGLGRELVAHLRNHNQTLVTTFFAPAVAAAEAGWPWVVCVVTDSDIARVWVPAEPHRSPILYCAPSSRAARRLRAYGVPPERVVVTGFPLPWQLTHEREPEFLAAKMAERLARLDPQGTFRRQYRDELRGALPQALDHRAAIPPRLTFAVGGAGAQVDLARQFLPSLVPLVRQGRLRLTLVAGVNVHVAQRFSGILETAGLGGESAPVEILYEANRDAYFERFNATLDDTDILWTKPSELTFFGALGIALVFAPPVGVHEVLNRRWAMERGAGLKQDHPAAAGQWIGDWLAEGVLAGAAWNGFRRLPRQGTRRIRELVATLGECPAC